MYTVWIFEKLSMQYTNCVKFEFETEDCWNYVQDHRIAPYIISKRLSVYWWYTGLCGDLVRNFNNPRFRIRIWRSSYTAWIISHKSMQYTNCVLISMNMQKYPLSLYTVTKFRTVCKLYVKYPYSLQTAWILQKNHI